MLRQAEALERIARLMNEIANNAFHVRVAIERAERRLAKHFPLR